MDLEWQTQDYDLIIIGGGIHGTAIARDASLRGLKVILFEKEDYACGASSKSSKLVHGGLRYLEYGHLGLVSESLSERSILLRTLPHQVKPLPFIFPVYSNDKRPWWLIKLGLFLYDLLSPQDLPRHRSITSSEISLLFPGLITGDLEAGFLYYDAQMLDHRIVISNLTSARHAGCIAVNHTEVVEFFYENQQVRGVYYHSPIGEKRLCRGKLVVNATGAWSDQILQRDASSKEKAVTPTKGVHLVLPQVHPSHALVLSAPQDARIFFLLPWNGYSLLGTTDTSYYGDLNHPTVDHEDIDYLLKAINHYFPKRNFTQTSILSSFAGLRPLHFSKTKNATHRHRKTQLIHSPSGLLTLVGGKYTTYRQAAQQVVDLVTKRIQRRVWDCVTHQTSFLDEEDKGWLTASDEELVRLASPYDLTLCQMKHLLENYGSECWNILKIIENHPEESRQVCPHHPHVYAEIIHAIKNEQAVTLSDWFQRRTQIAFLPCQGKYCVLATADKFGEILHWSPDVKQREIKNFSKENDAAKSGDLVDS